MSSLLDFKAMIRRGDFVVLDTETTGLDGEICQLALVGADGDTLIDTLVKPVGRIPSAATRIHGITNADVADAPGWGDVSIRLAPLLHDRDIIIYNAPFDRKAMRNSAAAARLPRPAWETLARFWCAMDAFAQIYGVPAGRYGYRSQKLTTAAQYYHLPVVGAHNALGDCRMTLGVARKIAGIE